MKNTITTYLRKHATRGPWRVEGAAVPGLKAAVVIPALAEEDRLFATLDDLAANDAALLAQTLVIVVVNNRVPPHADPADIANNRRTLARLRDYAAAPLQLAFIDAASPGLELSPKAGVGHARRIGLDAALHLLTALGDATGFLVCLDADTRVEPGYLGALFNYFAAPDAWAAAVNYAHDLDHAGDQIEAIVDYELYLRHYTLGLNFAGSPYGYHAIGSTVACTTRAYGAAGGMPRREAGEDFYYLQQLAKTGNVGFIDATTVRPAARLSRRVPFGTGRSLLDYRDDPVRLLRRFNRAEHFEVLRQLLQIAAHAESDAVRFLEAVEAVSPVAAAFLTGKGIEPAWKSWQANTGAPSAFRAQFHRWFDAFKTLKLLHALQAVHGSPPGVVQAVAPVMVRAGLRPPTTSATAPGLRRSLLLQLRAHDTAAYAGRRWNPTATYSGR